MARPYTRTLSPMKDQVVYGFFDREGKDELRQLSFVKKTFKVSSIIRFHPLDFAEIARMRSRSRLLTHFNLHDTSHIKGRFYLLVPIVKPGFFDGTKEQPPLIDFRKGIRAECLGVRNELSYDALCPGDFAHSIPSIKNPAQLARAILRRYKKSMAHISGKDKLKMGVGMTYLRFSQLHLKK